MRWYLLSISCVSRFKTKLFCTTSSAKNNHESPILQNEITESVLSKYLPLSTIPTESDLKCIGERQVFGNISGIFAVDSLKCKYGFPQAFVRYPFTPKISSGMIRLSCPLLVKAIDVYEANNGINKLNELVHQNHSIQSSFHKVNIRWKNIKNTFVSTEQKEMLVSKMGSHSANSFLNSGIIGISENKTNDVKCVHAQVADYLLSGGIYTHIHAIFTHTRIYLYIYKLFLNILIIFRYLSVLLFTLS